MPGGKNIQKNIQELEISNKHKSPRRKRSQKQIEAVAYAEANKSRRRDKKLKGFL